MTVKWLRALATGLCLAGALSACSSVSAGAGQDDELRKRVAALEAGQKEILKQLQEIKALLQQNRPAQPNPAQTQAAQAALTQPPTTPIGIEGAAARGSDKAKLTLVEFSDFQCPYCGKYSRETFSQIEHDYVDTGKIRYVFRHFPLARIHPMAQKAAEAAECARLQGKFWDLHTRLFANQQALAEPDLIAAAKASGVADAPAFQRCLAGAAAGKIKQDLDEGARLGVNATPTFFIGVVEGDGKLHALKKLTGALPLASFKSTLDALLAPADVKK